MSKPWEDMTESERRIVREQSVHLAEVAKRALAVDRVYFVTAEYGIAVSEGVALNDALKELLLAVVEMACAHMQCRLGIDLPVMLVEAIVEHMRKEHGLEGEFEIRDAVVFRKPPGVRH